MRERENKGKRKRENGKRIEGDEDRGQRYRYRESKKVEKGHQRAGGRKRQKYIDICMYIYREKKTKERERTITWPA